MQQTQIYTSALVVDAPVCTRCGGTGEFKCFRHVKAGVCFKCYGTKLDLPLIEARLEKQLLELRAEYRRIMQGAEFLKLAEVVKRGKAAAKALQRQRADTAALVAEFKAKS